VKKPACPGLLGVEQRAGQQQVPGRAPANPPDQRSIEHRRHQPNANTRTTDRGTLRSHSHVATRHEAGAACDRRSIHGCHHRLARGLHRGIDRRKVGEHGIQGVGFSRAVRVSQQPDEAARLKVAAYGVQIQAGAERVAGPGQHDAADRIGVECVSQPGAQRLQARGGKRVASLGIV